MVPRPLATSCVHLPAASTPSQSPRVELVQEFHLLHGLQAQAAAALLQTDPADPPATRLPARSVAVRPQRRYCPAACFNSATSAFSSAAATSACKGT